MSKSFTLSNAIEGLATEEGTRRFAKRFPDFPAGAFRRACGLYASSLGLGTYAGDPVEDSAGYRNSIREALRQGINVFDTAINYRFQASERDLGAALAEAIEAGEARRDEVVIITKGGFLPLDFAVGDDNHRKYLSDVYLKSGLCPPDDLVDGCHCLSAAFIEDQFDRSRANLGLEAIDFYLLHNPEKHFAESSRETVIERIRDAFGVLAQRVRKGQLGGYGVATWDGLRQPSGALNGLRLKELEDVAYEVEGHEHHFRAIQLPFNLAMSEAMRLEHDAANYPGLKVLEVAKKLELFTLTSASIMQGQLCANLPEQLHGVFRGLDSDATLAVQHNRCAPGVTSALVGMKTPQHVIENAGLLSKPSANPALVAMLYQAANG